MALNYKTLTVAALGLVLVGIFAGLSLFLVNKMSNDTSNRSFEDGKKAGIAEGEKSGYTTGFGEGKKAGYAEGLTAGKTEGAASVDIEAIKKKAYQSGYSSGLQSDQACIAKVKKYLYSEPFINSVGEIEDICSQ